MFAVSRTTIRAIAAATLVLTTALGVEAQDVIVTRYCPTTTVTYYPATTIVASPRTVAYLPETVTFYSPRVTYFEEPVRTVTYYSAPTVSYYPGSVTTTRYGLLGQPRQRTTYYPSYVVR